MGIVQPTNPGQDMHIDGVCSLGVAAVRRSQGRLNKAQSPDWASGGLLAKQLEMDTLISFESAR